MEQIALTDIDSYADIAKRYIWPVTAVILSPLLSWRIVQYIKLTAKRVNGHKPKPLTLDIAGFAIVYGLTYYAWTMYSVGNALFVAFCIGFMHTSIVKLVFAYAPKQVVEALAYGLADERTTLATVLIGKDRRAAKRPEPESDDQTRVLTDEERAEITNPDKR